MDLVLICRDGRADSFISNLLLAMEAREAGQQVAVLLSGEALAALTDGVFRWARQLTSDDVRLKMAGVAASLGIPVAGSGVSRIVDTKQVIAEAQKAGVSLIACYPWPELLEVADRLPDGVVKADAASVLAMLSEAKTIIGSL
ncbi:MAG TPA: hypothetical protein G4O09_04595 [Dehalococcoidia bacterium]|nr:hypothetical protein [Dehalococcoidia bacterium]